MRETVIIGNSAAGLSALEHFRKYDSRSPVTLITAETEKAYSRVLLPYFLRKQIPWENLFIRTNEYYSRLKVSKLHNTKVISADLKNGKLICENAEAGEKAIPFDQLLIATGANPMKPPIKGLEGPRVRHLWTFQDCMDLNTLFEKGRRVLILGSGFVALQAAWAALHRGSKVSVYELMDRIMPRVLDPVGAELLHEKITDLGVDLKTGAKTQEIQHNHDGSMTVIAEELPPLEVDAIIVGTGVRPNTDFLEEGSLEMDRGILINNRMETSVPGVYAAGDVALGSSVFGDTHISHALWPTAVEHGKIAGANLAGKKFDYRGSLNMNVTEMFNTIVASMGKFEKDTPEEDTYSETSFKHEATGEYLKILWENEQPMGGVLIGEAKDVPLFGALRALIRESDTLESSQYAPVIKEHPDLERLKHFFRLKVSQKEGIPGDIFQRGIPR